MNLHKLQLCVKVIEWKIVNFLTQEEKKISWKRGGAGASSTMAAKYLFSEKITSVQVKSSSILAFILLLNFADIAQGKVVFTKKAIIYS